jgi:hypothetical protein
VKKPVAFLGLLFFFLVCASAQEGIFFDLDIDSLFDEPPPETPAEENVDTAASSVLSMVKRRGLTVSASYEFQGGFAPGWDTSPWSFNGDEVFSWNPGARMTANISIDARLSEVFRVITVFDCNIPGFNLTLGDFFFDYNLLNTVYIRAGKYEHSWGISPNYGFTNILSRVPGGKKYGTSYIIKTDIPIGVGGIQALALTRTNLADNEMPGWGDVGFGGKYNLAFRWADFDMGIFYQDSMALRGFLSIKTTVLNTELYNEWLVAVNTHSDNAAGFAANFGFVRDFFGNKLTLNGEFFYNGEKGGEYYRPETSMLKEATLSFVEDFSLALNMLYRFGGKGNLRFFTQILYAPVQSSAQLVPGLRLNPLSHIDIYLAVPFALGRKTGYYYENTADPSNRPFSIILLVTITDNVQVGYYY